MRNRNRKIALLVVVLTLAVTLANASGQQPPRDVVKSQHAAARIRGRVTAEGQPVAGARVSALGNVAGEQYSAATDSSGRYDIGGIAKGSYLVRVVKDGFLSGTHANGTRLAVAEGATLDDIDVVLMRGVAIDGLVRDQTGAPVVAVEITALRNEFARGQRRAIPTGTRAKTDDRGEFRLFGLPPGEYYILATPPNNRQTLGELRPPPGTKALAPTYYPNTADLEHATPVLLRNGSQSVTVQLATAPLMRIEGVVVDASGAPVKADAVTARRTNGTNSAVAVNISDGGRFAVFRLVPGTYLVRTRWSDPAQPPAATTVTLTDHDVTNVVLRPVARSRITGHIRTSAPGMADALRSQRIQIGAVLLEAELTNLGGQRSGFMKDDFTFEFESWPGRALVRVTSDTANWALKAVRLGGVDLADSGLEVVNGQPIDGLEIELTDKPSLITGTLTTARNEPITDARVAIFSTDQERWREPSSRHVVMGQSDASGRFTIRALPEGDYYVAVVDADTVPRWNDPSTLARLRTGATRFTLGDGEQKTISVRTTRNP